MRGKWLVISGCVILLLVLGAGAAVWLRMRPKLAPAKPVAPPPTVYLGSVVSLTGKVEARRILPIGVPIDGVLEQFLVEAGQEVAEGQLLARVRSTALDAVERAATEELDNVRSRLNNTENLLIAARLEASRARADATRAGFERDRTLRIFERQSLLMKEGATPRLTFEKADTDYKKAAADFDSLDSIARAAEDRVASLQRDYDTTKRLIDDKQEQLETAKAHASSGDIHAPVDGIVVSLRGSAGDQVTPEIKDLITLAADLSQLQVALDTEPPVLKRIHGGEPAEVQLAEMGGQALPGSVREIRNGQIVVEFTSPNPAIKPGVTAQVRIHLS